MFRAILVGAGLFLSLAFGSVAWSAEPGQAPAKAPPAPAERDWTLGEPIRHGNLTIFPVISKTAKNDDRFLTLDEGLKAGTVEIREVSAATNGGATNSPPAEPANSENGSPRGQQSGLQQLEQTVQRAAGHNEVNRLLVTNKSSKSLYLMPGEILIGGDQDRTVGRELVIAPSKTPVSIDVFCVEHGRWGSRDERAYAGLINGATASTDRRESVALNGSPRDAAKLANAGNFIGSVGNLNKSARVAVQNGAGQKEVWKEVGKANGTSKVTSQSGAFTGQYSETEAVKRLDPYLEKLQKPVAETKQVIGVVVAVNGKVDSFDAFESTPLFLKLWPKLLKSYALDAANAASEKAAAEKLCSASEALAFVNEMEKSASTKTEKKGNLASTHYASERFDAFSVRDAKASPSAPAGIGGGIHTSGFAK